jgi:hypothetical protein
LEHDETVAIIGGYTVTDGPLMGKFVFGDVPSGRLFFADLAEENAVTQTWGIRYQGKEMSLQELVGNDRVDLKFGRDASNTLFIMSKTNGAVYKVVAD